jgi:uncharacterized RDD family membrane protein YckC
MPDRRPDPHLNAFKCPATVILNTFKSSGGAMRAGTIVDYVGYFLLACLLLLPLAFGVYLLPGAGLLGFIPAGVCYVTVLIFGFLGYFMRPKGRRHD